jgi:hypothetical protein
MPVPGDVKDVALFHYSSCTDRLTQTESAILIYFFVMNAYERSPPSRFFTMKNVLAPEYMVKTCTYLSSPSSLPLSSTSISYNLYPISYPIISLHIISFPISNPILSYILFNHILYPFLYSNFLYYSTSNPILSNPIDYPILYSILFYTMLSYAISYAMLCYAMLCYPILSLI